MEFFKSSRGNKVNDWKSFIFSLKNKQKERKNMDMFVNFKWDLTILIAKRHYRMVFLPYLKEKQEKLFGICHTEMRKFNVISQYLHIARSKVMIWAKIRWLFRWHRLVRWPPLKFTDFSLTSLTSLTGMNPGGFSAVTTPKPWK